MHRRQRVPEVCADRENDHTPRPNATHGAISRRYASGERAGTGIYSTSRSCDGGMRGGDGERTSAPLTVL